MDTVRMLKDRIVNINKEQFCVTCDKKFKPGSVMQYQVAIVEGDFCSHYRCSPCHSELLERIRNLKRMGNE